MSTSETQDAERELTKSSESTTLSPGDSPPMELKKLVEKYSELKEAFADSTVANFRLQAELNIMERYLKTRYCRQLPKRSKCEKVAVQDLLNDMTWLVRIRNVIFETESTFVMDTLYVCFLYGIVTI